MRRARQGFSALPPGQGHQIMQAYHKVTPGRLQHYGLMRARRTIGRHESSDVQLVPRTAPNPQSKMAAIANATGLDVPAVGLLFPPCGRRRTAAGDAATRGAVLEKIRWWKWCRSLERRPAAACSGPELGRICRAGGAERYAAMASSVWVKTDARGAMPRCQAISLIGLEPQSQLCRGVTQGADRAAQVSRRSRFGAKKAMAARRCSTARAATPLGGKLSAGTGEALTAARSDRLPIASRSGKT